MKQHRIFVIFLVVWALTAGYVASVDAQEDADAAKRVLLKEDREATLAKMGAILKPAETDFDERIGEVLNPFELYQEPEPVMEPEPVAVVDSLPTLPTAAPVAKKKDDAVPPGAILRTVANLLKPRGSMIVGTNKIMFSAKGARLKEGDELPLKIRGKPYVVVVDTITQRDYTLRLGGETLTKPYQSGLSKGSIKFDSKNE